MNRPLITLGLILTLFKPISLFSQEPNNAVEKSISTPTLRIYEVPLTKKNKEDITYIVTTLADKSLARIIWEKKSLEEAGDRIESIHPLNFLLYVFTEEELKIAMLNIKSRGWNKKGGWIWSDFIAGLSRSLKEEQQKNNLKQEYVEEFAEKVNVDLEIINPHIRKGKWEKLVEALITHVPREGDPDRYNF